MTHNVFGRPAGDYATARSQLEWGGLHRSDPRFAFAERALQAATPGRRAAMLKRFACVPARVPVPVGCGFGGFDEWINSEPRLQPILATLDTIIAEGGADLATLPRVWAAILQPMHASIVDRSMTFSLFISLASILPGRSGALDIVCLPHAFMLAVCVHANHRAAAVEWLTPYAATWLRDWLLERPAFAVLFVHARQAWGDLPDWLAA